MTIEIRHEFAALAATWMLGVGMLVGTGTASADGGHYRDDYKSYDQCWNDGFIGFGFGIGAGATGTGSVAAATTATGITGESTDGLAHRP